MKTKMNAFVLMWCVSIIGIIITSTCGSLAGTITIAVPFLIILLLHKFFEWKNPTMYDNMEK